MIVTISMLAEINFKHVFKNLKIQSKSIKNCSEYL